MGEKKKILLVDDEADFTEVTSLLLESNGYDVVTAASGADGREVAAREKPDAIILDVMMETRSAGFEVARWLRSRDDLRHIPIIMLTAVNQAYPMNFQPDEVWLPVDVFLDKPVQPDKLVAHLQKALG